jgi:hypothetical protein
VELNFSHIGGNHWKKFQSIVQDYFEELKNHEKYPTITKVKAIQSGSGSDKGKDVIVDLEIEDSVFNHKIRWIVQCKCYKGNVRPKDLYGVNIPTLVHSHNATGYLLVCKNGVTNDVVDLFDKLSKDCKMDYKYVIWTGEEFLKKIQLIKWDTNYYQRHFNGFHIFMKKQAALMDSLKQSET